MQGPSPGCPTWFRSPFSVLISGPNSVPAAIWMIMLMSWTVSCGMAKTERVSASQTIARHASIASLAFWHCLSSKISTPPPPYLSIAVDVPDHLAGRRRR